MASKGLDTRYLVVLSTLALFSLSGLFHYGSFRGVFPHRAIGIAHEWSVAEIGGLQFLQPANSTLGFGAIIAVPQEDSFNREELVFAANITNINVQVPSQSTWTATEIEETRILLGNETSRNDSRRHLTHINALTSFLRSDLETVLILEDSADWDTHLRTSQIPSVAAAVRELSRRQTGFASQMEDIPELTTYWGIIEQDWDVLYLGGSPNEESEKEAKPRLVFPDRTMLPILSIQNLPQEHRVLQKTDSAHNSLAYAMTRSAARDFIDVHSQDEHNKQSPKASINDLCRSKTFHCLSVIPGLFQEGDAKARPASKTSGIACSARRDIPFARDPKVLAYLQNAVGEEGRCVRDDIETVEKAAHGARSR